MSHPSPAQPNSDPPHSPTPCAIQLTPPSRSQTRTSSQHHQAAPPIPPRRTLTGAQISDLKLAIDEIQLELWESNSQLVKAGKLLRALKETIESMGGDSMQRRVVGQRIDSTDIKAGIERMQQSARLGGVRFEEYVESATDL
ncbi:hypothetical protein K504DRAFT_498072 [Pleomassaria siparia CBS 279.74]|uniref:Uncharacterized protein n=1 Tax=Pleomassaria siparia CBS 279.74 TaxID=1314801 RepID=A0A6G1KLM1_9PLEO|nr:hypothetical protein K504DRAFT_498072 [Pleomassaria siparia CBS 279.74]